MPSLLPLLALPSAITTADLDENFPRSTLCKQGASRRRVPLGTNNSGSLSSLKV